MIRKIHVEQLIDKQDFGEKVVQVEVGENSDYDSKHIAKAIFVPAAIIGEKSLGQLRKWAATYLDPGYEIILYSNSRFAAEVTALARALTGLCYPNIYLLALSKEEWIRQGLPIDGIFPPIEAVLPTPAKAAA